MVEYKMEIWRQDTVGAETAMSRNQELLDKYQKEGWTLLFYSVVMVRPEVLQHHFVFSRNGRKTQVESSTSATVAVRKGKK